MSSALWSHFSFVSLFCIPYVPVVNEIPDTQATTPKKREEHLSKDGQWRSFPKVPHLLQYVSNGNYYGRIKVAGKVIRESLQTTVWTTAKLRLTDFLEGTSGKPESS